MPRKSRAELVSIATKGMNPIEALVYRACDSVKYKIERHAKTVKAQQKYNKSQKGKNKNARHRWKNQTIYKDKKKASDKLGYQNARPSRLAKMALYRRENRKEVNRRSYECQKKRRLTDPSYVAACRLRSRIGNFLRNKGMDKDSSTFQMIGCTSEELSRHLGIGDNLAGRHIDHVFPLAKFAGEKWKVNHYSNLQLLTREENLDKSDKLPTKAMAAKVDRDKWPPGITEDMLPDIYPGWATPLRMHAAPTPGASSSTDAAVPPDDSDSSDFDYGPRDDSDSDSD